MLSTTGDGDTVDVVDMDMEAGPEFGMEAAVVDMLLKIPIGIPDGESTGGRGGVYIGGVMAEVVLLPILGTRTGGVFVVVILELPPTMGLLYVGIPNVGVVVEGADGTTSAIDFELKTRNSTEISVKEFPYLLWI